MPARAFFDTNVLIYALAKGDPRSKRPEELLAAGGVLSVQILNEFVSVARRKILMSWSEVMEALGVIRPKQAGISLASDARTLARAAVGELGGVEFVGLTNTKFEDLIEGWA